MFLLLTFNGDALLADVVAEGVACRATIIARVLAVHIIDDQAMWVGCRVKDKAQVKSKIDV